MTRTSHSIPRDHDARWTSLEAYLLAVVCLLVGVAIGYFVRGSAAPQAGVTAANTVAPTASTGAPPEASPEELKRMADVQAQPLLQQLQGSSRDADLLARIGNIYYDAHQYNQAISYYDRSLQIRPDNPDVRTDMGTSYWYLNNPDRAIAEFEKSLTYNPNHAGTLLNLGVVKWQGRNDSKGAVDAWEKLQRVNPEFAARQNIAQRIQQVKLHMDIKPGTTTNKPAQ